MWAAAWIGPAIVAAIISALVTASGWLVAHRQTLRVGSLRRRERLVDVQTALRAEIRSYLHHTSSIDFRSYTKDVTNRMLSADDPPFIPFIPKDIETVMFDALAGEIHILPEAAIDPIVLYYRQVRTVSLFAEDLRSDRFVQLSAERKADMYRDYMEMKMVSVELGQRALDAIAASLATLDDQ